MEPHSPSKPDPYVVLVTTARRGYCGRLHYAHDLAGVKLVSCRHVRISEYNTDGVASLYEAPSRIKKLDDFVTAGSSAPMAHRVVLSPKMPSRFFTTSEIRQILECTAHGAAFFEKGDQEHTWEWALVRMAGGNLVRRTDWPQEDYIRRTSEGLMRVLDGTAEQLWTPAHADKEGVWVLAPNVQNLRRTKDTEMHAEGTWGWAKNELLSGRAEQVYRIGWTSVIMLVPSGGVASQFMRRQMTQPETPDVAWAPEEADQEHNDWRVMRPLEAQRIEDKETVEMAAVPRVHTWDWAAEQMICGRFVRRKGWAPEEYIHRDGKGKLWKGPTTKSAPIVYTLADVDENATDWDAHVAPGCWEWTLLEMAKGNKVRRNLWEEDDYIVNSKEGVLDSAGAPWAPSPSTATEGTWEWAQVMMEDGSSVRRKDWDDGCSIKLNALGDYTADNGAGRRITWCPYDEDKDATNWTVIEPVEGHRARRGS